jgi:branched-chain amino acid transport system substrate-binding protein
MNLKRIVLLFTRLLTSAALIACGSEDSGTSDSGSGGGDTVKIGFSGDFSGLLAAYDVPVRDGMEFAAEQINASNGPYKVELVTEDNKSDPQLTVSQTQKLLDEGALLNVIGTGDGRNAAASLVGDAGGLSLGTLNTYPGFVEEAGENSALLTVTDNIQAAASAKYACDQGYKSVYTFGSDDFAYSKGLPEYFADAFEHYCDGKISGTANFSLGATDFSAQITDLKNADPQPDAIYSPMFVPDSVAFAKQLRQAGVDLPYLSSDANYIQDFIDSAGQASEGVVTSPYAFAGSGTPLKKFQDEFEKSTGRQVATPLYEAIGRDQVYAIVDAAVLAGSTDPEAIMAEFGELKDDTFVAMTNGTFDPELRRPSTADIPIVAIKDGKFEVVAEVTPDYVPEPVR